MFGLGKRRVSSEDAAKAFIEAAFLETEATYDNWTAFVCHVAGLTGPAAAGSQEMEAVFRRRFEQAVQPQLAYCVARMADCLPAAGNLLDSKAGQDICSQIHRQMSGMVSEDTRWAVGFLFELLQDVDNNRKYFANIPVRLLEQIGIGQTEAERRVVSDPIFQHEIAPEFVKQPLSDWWKNFSNDCKIAS